jgi:predicted nucleic acid-binding Zn ribbon protein
LPHAVDEDDRDDEDGDSVDEDPLESDQDADDAEESIVCPFCKRSLHEDADVCPRCGNFIGGEDAPRRRVPMFIWIGVILAGICVLVWIALGM